MIHFASARPATKAAIIACYTAVTVLMFMLMWIVIATIGLGIFPSQIKGLISAVPWLIHYNTHPTVRLWNMIGGGTSFAVIALSFIIALAKRKGSLHGQARWASEIEIERNNLRAKRGIILGKKGRKYLVFGGSEHVMLYAPTRTGKGVGVVIPNLLNWPDSVVVLDIKKENWDVTAGFRADNGQRVILFDPLDPKGRSSRYNPLSYIERGNTVQVLDELQKIATMLFTTPDKGDPFWAEASRSGFIGVGGYVAETPGLPFTIGEIYRQLTMGDPKARLGAIVKDRMENGPSLSVGTRSALSDFLSASDNTFAGIKQTITSRMSLWLNPRIDAVTSASDFDIRKLRSERTSIYLGVSPDNMARVAPLYNLFFQQLVDLNTRELPDAKTEPYQVLVLLDEFARLGNASVIARGFSYVAGYGLRLLPVLQSPSQLRAEYGPDVADEIMTNCGIEIIFTPKELKVAQEVSDRLGYRDFKAISKSRPTAFGNGHRSTSQSDQRRALMLPQELLTMPTNELIVLRGGIPPIKGEKITYYDNADFKKRITPPPAIKALRASLAAVEFGSVEAEAVDVSDDTKPAEMVEVERDLTEAELSGAEPIKPQLRLVLPNDEILHPLDFSLTPEQTAQRLSAFMALVEIPADADDLGEDEDETEFVAEVLSPANAIEGVS